MTAFRNRALPERPDPRQPAHLAARWIARTPDLRKASPSDGFNTPDPLRRYLGKRGPFPSRTARPRQRSGSRNPARTGYAPLPMTARFPRLRTSSSLYRPVKAHAFRNILSVSGLMIPHFLLLRRF